MNCDIKKIVDMALEDEELETKEFPYIQDMIIDKMNEELMKLPKANVDEAWHEIIPKTGDEFLYPILKGFQQERGIKLYTEELEKNLTLHPMRKRASEVLGSGLNELDGFYEKIKEQKAEVLLLGPVERGFIYLVKAGDFYVVKPLQGKEENKIALVASELGIGPKVEQISEGWIAEEFVKGPKLSQLFLTSKQRGKILGHIFGNLHGKDISYNDSFDRHLFACKRGPVLIDYGVASFKKDFSEDMKYIKDYLNNKKGAMKSFMKVYNVSMKNDG